MNILFIGCVEFSAKALQRVINSEAKVVGVCTLKKSSFNSDFFDLSVIAKANDIPWIYAENINDINTTEWMTKLKPDIIFCFGWSSLLKENILSITPNRVLGFHPAELPANKGRHPIIWSLILGLKRTASTFFFMDNRADSGDILSQNSIEIDDSDDARSLYNKITEEALNQIDHFIPQLMSNKFKRYPQNNKNSNFWRKRTKVDGIIDWRMDAIAIHNTVRALSEPYPGANFIHNQKSYILWKTEVIYNDYDNLDPGKILDSKDIIIKCGSNAIKLIKTEPELCSLKQGEYI